ncbi:hypothetical protein COCMIDRAFT_10277 [Bipolaris oryzae ATCC 44560]|uniref:Uncharacterized protein n=1 Tax=Bipolaris oryzae ATCC 44560 TaxID=930090 RepID=W6YVW9_COCMI|nr:uncharacterized protein COCMIDRAFT_10277 [Bipolaris oryzae ATCC 44560]EUC39664.1 hypothetical protein COCMIDRAFT_10277 [Bipolaris oryzae ATCC 44560]
MSSTQYTVAETVTVPRLSISSRPRNLAPRPFSWRPYLELTRFSKPAGLLGVYFPYFIGLLYSVNLTNPRGLSAADWFKLIVVFLLDGLLIRSLGCAWNDTVDQDLDRQVERCKKRPLARGAITTPEALAATLLLSLARHALLYATLSPRANQHALLITILGFAYPFMKRVCNFPQLCLGLGVGWAVFLVDAAVADGYRTGNVSKFNKEDRNKATFAMFASQALFNITYDTIYAFQDIRDDLKADVGSLAVAVRHQPKLFLLSVASAMAALLWVAVSCGRLVLGPFQAGAVFASLSTMVMLIRINVWNPRMCRDFFVHSQWWVSGALLAGLLGELIMNNMQE